MRHGTHIIFQCFFKNTVAASIFFISSLTSWNQLSEIPKQEKAKMNEIIFKERDCRLMATKATKQHMVKRLNHITCSAYFAIKQTRRRSHMRQMNRVLPKALLALGMSLTDSTSTRMVDINFDCWNKAPKVLIYEG